MSDFHFPYTPREQMLPFHNRQERYALMVCHRRFGKTVGCVGELILRAIYTKKKNAEFAYVGPFRQQAKKIAWAYLKEFTEGIRKGPPRESDLCITLLNNAKITIYGADNPDTIRGLFFDGVVIDEYGNPTARHGFGGFYYCLKERICNHECFQQNQERCCCRFSS